MGLLESVRRLAEFLMNGLVIVVLMIWVEQTVTIMRVFMITAGVALVGCLAASLLAVINHRIAAKQQD